MNASSQHQYNDVAVEKQKPDEAIVRWLYLDLNGRVYQVEEQHLNNSLAKKLFEQLKKIL